MNRLLLALWLLGAALYAGNTFLYTNAIFGWPKEKAEADAHKEAPRPAPVAKLQDRQPAEIAESQSPPPSSQLAPQSNQAPAGQPQSKHAPGIGAGAPGAGSVASAPAQPVPQGQLAPGISAQQQVQSAPPPQQGADASSSQAAANAAPPVQQAQSTPQPPQPDQAASAAEPPQGVEPEQPQQSEGEWVKSRGATVRSAPSSSASALTNLDSGAEVRVVGRQSGWVQIASSDGSKTGWVYEKLLEPSGSPDGSAAAGPSEQPKSQSGWVKVLGSPAGMRSTPSQSSPILFAFPEGRELRVVSREPGWVQVKDPGSRQTGWVAETSLIASDGKAKSSTATASTERQQAPSASTERQSTSTSRRQPASASSQRQSPPQRRSRDAGPDSYENAEGPPPRGRNFVPWEAEMNAPAYVEERENRPRRWWRRRGGFAFFGREDGED